ncbi:hypothetical protein [Paraclostridium bifermentans]|uniref:hypothetical protein n=1 Tax=Paraclostridium bifermentans TaxID=1490 RepID=UPI00374E2987
MESNIKHNIKHKTEEDKNVIYSFLWTFIFGALLVIGMLDIKHHGFKGDMDALFLVLEALLFVLNGIECIFSFIHSKGNK